MVMGGALPDFQHSMLRRCPRKSPGYNGKPSPELPYGVTLNVMLSVLASDTKSSLIFVTSTAIGQLKRIWYRQNTVSVHAVI
ncbi:hypothetical protein BDV12DRAFT_181109 [Aspergillus spectabilis]